MNVDIDEVFDAQKNIFSRATGFEPKFKIHGGSVAENLALQNVQARSRMVTAYEFSQLLPTVVSFYLSWSNFTSCAADEGVVAASKRGRQPARAWLG